MDLGDYSSRQAEWDVALDMAHKSLSAMREAMKELLPDLRRLHEVAALYQHWDGKVPANSPAGKKLEKVLSILIVPVQDFEKAEKLVEDALFHVEYCERSELPRGYGNDRP